MGVEFEIYHEFYTERPSTVIRELKKKSHLQQVNLQVLKQLNPEQINVEIRLAESFEEVEGPESELDAQVELGGQKI
jgi:hypothetical protein